MSSIIRKSAQRDYFFVASALAYQPNDKNLLEIANRFSEAVDRLLPAKTLCDAINLRLTKTALNCGLYFRTAKPLALISGAGIAGLAASFELRARGFNVVIAEKRKCFSRFNVVNLNIETQVFLRKFNLLEKFEALVAAKIREHRYVLVDKSQSIKRLAVSDVSELQVDESLSFRPENFGQLFENDGIYSVPIKVLQTFLAENALKAGIKILGDATVRVLSRTRTGGVSKAQITFDQIVRPDLFFIAEGSHSKTCQELGIKTKKMANVCSGENWIFGNMPYFGRETFVISLIDSSSKTLRIANVIFNAKSQLINIAVTVDKKVSKDLIRKQLIQTAHQVFTQKAFPLEEITSELSSAALKPVKVTNRISFPFSIDNVFCIGDAAGSSSPLSGLGATLGLTLVPQTVKQLLEDYERKSDNLNQNFHKFSEGYVLRRIQKSEGVKKLCLSIFDKEQTESDEISYEN